MSFMELINVGQILEILLLDKMFEVVEIHIQFF